MARTLISFPVELAPQGDGRWLSDAYMWKKLEGIQDYLECDFLCLFIQGFKPTNCFINLPSEKVLGIIVPTGRIPYFLKKAAKLRIALNHLLEKRPYKNLILFEPLPLNLYLAQIGRRRKMNVISWLSGNHYCSNMLAVKNSHNLYQMCKETGKWALESFIIKCMTKVSRMMISDSPHLYRNRLRTVFAPSQTINSKEMGALPFARVGEKETPSLLFVGRVVPLKGLHILIQALTALKEQLLFHLTIVGPLYGPEYGGYEFTLRRLIQEKGLSRRVTLTGNISDRRELEKHYLQSDLFVLPSMTEGTPKAILEAMAYGLPVIASRVGGIPIVVRDGRDGILIDPWNPMDLQAALRRILGDRQRLRLMGQSGRERSLQLSKERIFRILAQEIAALP
jgi:glycosyltransferase involved in cell wall biosynthesis